MPLYRLGKAGGIRQCATETDLGRRVGNPVIGIDEAKLDARIGLAQGAQSLNELRDPLVWHTDFLPHEESLALLAGCDVIALPYQSSKEASSAALRTALGAGPLVAVTPLALFGEAEDAVYRFTGTDAASIAQGLGTLLENREQRAALQNNARLWLESRAWPNVGRRFQDMLIGLHIQASVKSKD